MPFSRSALVVLITAGCQFTALAQRDSARFHSPRHSIFRHTRRPHARWIAAYSCISIGNNWLFHPQDNGTIGISFPYTSTLNSGNTFMNTFTGRTANPFSNIATAFSANAQFGKRKFFFDILGGTGLHNDINFLLGVGRTVYTGHPAGGKIFIKTVLDIGGSLYTHQYGNIDNYLQRVKILGNTFDSTFVYNGIGNSPNQIVHSYLINVNYEQDVYMFVPRLQAEYHPFNTRFFVDFEISYAIPFTEPGYVTLTQRNGGARGIERDISLRDKGLLVTFNGRPVTAAPYAFNGFQFAIRIGYSNKNRGRSRTNDAIP